MHIRRTRPGARSLFQDERGAAYAEAVIMLPVYILVFALFYMVHDAAIAKTVSMSEARQAGWTAAFDDCGEGDSSDGACTSCSDVTDDGTIFGELTGELSGGEGLGGALLGAIEPLITGIFGGQVTRTGTADYTRPVYLGGATVTVSSNYTMVCNPERMTLASILSGVWDSITGGIL